MVNLAFLEIVFPADAEKFGLLPRSKVFSLSCPLCELESLMLGHLLLAVGHLELEALVDLLELL